MFPQKKDMTPVKKCGFQLPQNPHNSPDSPRLTFISSLNSNHTFLVSSLDIRAVEKYLGVQDASFSHEGIARLEHRWTNCICIDVKGNYFEQERQIVGKYAHLTPSYNHPRNFIAIASIVLELGT